LPIARPSETSFLKSPQSMPIAARVEPPWSKAMPVKGDLKIFPCSICEQTFQTGKKVDWLKKLPKEILITIVIFKRQKRRQSFRLLKFLVLVEIRYCLVFFFFLSFFLFSIEFDGCFDVKVWSIGPHLTLLALRQVPGVFSSRDCPISVVNVGCWLGDMCVW